MNDVLQRLKQRKLVQWGIAYIAGAWALLQVLDLVGQEFGWPGLVLRIVTVVLGIGFFVALVLAWYHGDRGAQRVGGVELGMLAALLVIAAVAVTWVNNWHTRAPARHVATASAPVAPAATVHSSATRSARVAPLPAPAMSIAAIPAKSVAVLPFENLSADKNNAYFVAGMQDLILTKLADIGDLKVISRTSTAKYASHPSDLKAIARQLDVATILEGSVQKAGNVVLINVQLIDARTDSHIWAKAYQRKLDNIFGVEGDVAGKIAVALKAKLSAAQTAQLAAVPTTNQAAYDLFLRAEYQASQGQINYDTASMKAAIPLYRQAIKHDSGFALAYARLSYVESTLAWEGGAGENVEQLDRQARADADHALRLAPDLAAAHLALGFCDYFANADYPGALKAFGAALALKPNDPDALEARGYVERRIAHLDAAIASFKEAFALDPRNSSLASELGTTYALAGRNSDAERTLQRALAIDPHNLQARIRYGNTILSGTGDVARALQAAQGDAPRTELWRVRLLTDQRKYPGALTLLDGVPNTPDNFPAYGASKALRRANLYRLMLAPSKSKPLFRQALATARKQLAIQQGTRKAVVWQSIADAELGLGRTRDGLESIAKSLAIAKKSPDLINHALLRRTGAALYVQAGRADLAVPPLTKVLADPAIRVYPPVMLWLDPAWDPIRHDPRFQALLKKYAKFKPAVLYAAPASASSGAGHG